MTIGQYQLKNYAYPTLALIRAANGRENEISTCIETGTTYKFVTEGATYGQDNRYALTTGNGGNTRWVGIAGRYSYDSQLELSVNENLVFDVDTRIGDGASKEFQFATYSGGTYDFYVNWGDGTFDRITLYNDPATLHTYPRVGVYTVTIVGLVLGFASQPKVVAIRSFGKLTTMGTFEYMAELVSLPSNPYNIISGTQNRTPYQIFRECTALKVIDLSHYAWTSNYYDGFYEFCAGCNNAEVINMKGMIVYDLIREMSGAFNACSKVEVLDFSTMDISGWYILSYTFNICTKLKYIKGLGGYNFSNITLMNFAFCGTEEIIDIDIDGTANFTSLTDIAYAFNGSGVSDSLAVKMLNAMVNSPINYMDSVFANCDNLTTLDLSVLDLSAVTSLREFVAGCSNLTTLVINGADLGLVTDLYGAIYASPLTSIGLDTWNISSVTDMSFFTDGAIDTTEYSNALIYWATLPLQTGGTCDMGNSKYNVAGGVARAYIIATFSFVFLDGGPA